MDDVGQFDAVTNFNAQIEHVSRMPDLIVSLPRRDLGAAGPGASARGKPLGQITEAELDALVDKPYVRAPSFRPGGHHPCALSREIHKCMLNLGFTPEGGTPDDFAAFVARDAARFKHLVQETGVKPKERGPPYRRSRRYRPKNGKKNGREDGKKLRPCDCWR